MEPMYKIECNDLVAMAKKDSNKKFISLTDQHIIDAVRTYRLNLGISQKVVSSKVSLSENTSMIGQAESVATTNRITDPTLHIIAHFYTEEAKKMNSQFTTNEELSEFKSEYTVHDFYPSEPLPDIRVEKSINVVSNKLYPTGALNYILEFTDFLSIPRTTKEVTQEANKLFEKEWKTTDFGNPLDRAKEKGNLKKTDPPSVVTYQKLKSKNNANKH